MLKHVKSRLADVWLNQTESEDWTDDVPCDKLEMPNVIFRCVHAFAGFRHNVLDLSSGHRRMSHV
jgi:hypothetical protein